MRLRELMTEAVITAGRDEVVAEVARIMRDRGVGSVVVTDGGGEPVAIVTDRDLALRVLAERRDPAATAVSACASAPLIVGDPEMELEEAAALMVGHRIRRLPVTSGGRLAGIVTLDDIAVRTGNLEVAQRMTADVIEGALPDFFFHERG